MKKKVLLLTVAIGLLSATSAFAHPHHLETPGGKCVDISQAQTKIHANVHAGTPAQFAFDQGGQIEFGRGTCPSE